MDACTIISGNYLPLARTMVNSYRKHHPDGRFFVLILDKPNGTDFSDEPWETVFAEDLGMGGELDALRMLYDAYEMSMSLRPALLLYLMRKKNAKSIVLLDSDLYFLGRLEGAEELLKNHAISICASIRKPLPDDGKHPLDNDFILAGSLNGGFVLCRRCEETERMMEWLDAKLRAHSFYRPYEGYFGDQKWLDLLPSFCDTLGIIKKAEWNVAYWNLHERPLSKKGDTYCADGAPIVFFHFSGFRPNQPEVLSAHQSRYTMAEQPVFQMLADEYRAALKANGYDEWNQRSYGYNFFTNGVRISPVIRRAYEEIGGAKRFAHPHECGKGSFEEWLQHRYRPHSPITNLHMSIWRMSLEAKGRFQDPIGKDAGAFAHWVLHERKRELALDPMCTKTLTSLTSRQKLSARIRLKNMAALRHVFPPYQALCKTVKRVIGKELYDRMKPKQNSIFGYQHFRLHRTDKRPEGITVLSAVSGQNGIAEAARNLVRAFHHAGIPTEHLDSRTAPGRQDLVSPLRKKMWYDTTVLAGGAEEIGDMIRQTEFVIGPNQRMIACLPWESDILPAEYATGLHTFDEVWTCSSYAQAALQKYLTIPVVLLPNPVDVSVVGEADFAAFGLREDAFTCLFLFDFHSRIERKNPEAVIKSFLQAFGDDLSAQLLIVGTHADDFPIEANMVRTMIEKHPNIVMHTTWLPRAVVIGLLQQADCYMSLHRCEGFGQSIAEAMLLGTPTLATDFGGSTDFVSTETGWPIPFSPMTLRKKVGPYAKGTLWAEADTDAAAASLRDIREHPDAAKKRAEAGASFIKKHFSLEAVAEKTKAILARQAALPKS